jgi:hypothetical protein
MSAHTYSKHKMRPIEMASLQHVNSVSRRDAWFLWFLYPLNRCRFLNPKRHSIQIFYTVLSGGIIVQKMHLRRSHAVHFRPLLVLRLLVHEALSCAAECQTDPSRSFDKIERTLRTLRACVPPCLPLSEHRCRSCHCVLGKSGQQSWGGLSQIALVS